MTIKFICFGSGWCEISEVLCRIFKPGQFGGPVAGHSAVPLARAGAHVSGGRRIGSILVCMAGVLLLDLVS